MGDEAVVESGCSALEAAEPLTRGQQGEQCMMGVRGVLNDGLCPGQAASACSVVDGRKCCTDDTLRCSHHSFYTFPV